MIQKDKTYMVLNYGGSPVSVTTKNGSILFESGSKDSPWVQPMSLDEIITANTNGYAFKCGLLWFESDIEAEMYDELRIHNWRDILKDWEIEDILLHPSADGYKKLIAIEHPMYFDRVRGVLMGLKSIFADIPNQSKVLIDARCAEIREGKRRSEIKITKIESANNYNEELEDKNREIESLRAELEALKKTISENNAEVAVKAESDKPKKSTVKSAK